MIMNNKFLKLILFCSMIFVIVAGLSFPVTTNPQQWYEFPLIKGLEDKARIIFFHVPTAWLAVIAFFSAMFYGVKYLRNGELLNDIKSYTALKLGIIFCVLATTTGSIWAKFSWGAFWHWDPRETSIFILFLIYGALFALRSAVDEPERRARLSAVYSILSFLTVPFFVFIMPRIMTGLHPGSADDSTSGPVVNFHMNGNMLLVFFISLGAFTLLYLWLWNIGFRTAVIENKMNEKKMRSINE